MAIHDQSLCPLEFIFNVWHGAEIGKKNWKIKCLENVLWNSLDIKIPWWCQALPKKWNKITLNDWIGE